MALAFVFPGQGSQAVGMGRDLADAFPAARHVFQEVDDALGQKLSKLMWLWFCAMKSTCHCLWFCRWLGARFIPQR